MAKTDSEREDTRQFRELRKEIIKVRKENSQLRKRLHQLEGFLSDKEMLAQETSVQYVPETPQVESITKEPCPSCGAYDIIKFPVLDRMYYKCHSCLSKGRVKTQ